MKPRINATRGLRPGVVNIDDLRLRCTIDPATRCWIWQGASGEDGCPRIHTFDHSRGEKRIMPGPKAAWNIAHQAAPLPGWRVMRTCGCRNCVNPAHLREMRSQKAVGEFQRRAGHLVGKNTEVRRTNIRAAHAKAGVVYMPDEVVLAIRNAHKSFSGRALAASYCVSEQTISKIRRGVSYRGVE